MRPLLVLPLLAGCTLAASQLDPPLAQLARWRDATPAAIAAEPVVAPCPAGNPACPRLHARRAEACLSLAMAARAPGATCPGPAERPRLDCAAAGYTAAPDAALAGNAAQALLCRAELQAPAAALADAAAAGRLADQAGNTRLAAWAALLRARLVALPERCAALTEARRLGDARIQADLALLGGC